MTTKSIHIGAILSVTDGKLVSPNHIDGVYELLSHVTGESLFTHQLPRAAQAAEGPLREQFPDLAAIEVPEGLDSMAKVHGYLASLEAQYGTHRDVEPLPEGAYAPMGAFTELAQMAPHLQVIPVVVDEDPADPGRAS